MITNPGDNISSHPCSCRHNCFNFVPILNMCPFHEYMRREKLVELREVEKQATHDLESFLRSALSLPDCLVPECLFLLLK